ncbi:hypothetical protein ACFLXY_08470 [Chloroflexota bacterium]
MNWLERAKQKHRKICPNCKLVNPVSAEECYCGYIFRVTGKEISRESFSKSPSMIFTILVFVMMGFIIFSMVEGFIIASCDRLNIN